MSDLLSISGMAYRMSGGNLYSLFRLLFVYCTQSLVALSILMLFTQSETKRKYQKE